MNSKEDLTVRRRNDSVTTELPGEGGLDRTGPSEAELNGDSDDDSGISDQSNSEVSTLVQTVSNHPSSPTKNVDENGSLCRNFVQIFFPFIIAGAGMMLAGILLDFVQVSTK